jgi:radical SAM superfamily enzyme YgiQ (UPF0313 family)
MIRRGLHKKMVWITETRVDLVDDELMAAMYEGGLRRVMFGFETGSQEQLKRIRKGAKVDRGIEAARAAKRAGVGVVGFFMIGIPGSTREDIECTIKYASRALDIDFAKFTVFVPYPGTAEYEKLKKAGAMPEPENWDRFTSYPTGHSPAGVRAGGNDGRGSHPLSEEGVLRVLLPATHGAQPLVPSAHAQLA